MALSNAAKDIVIKIKADDAQYQQALKKADANTASFARGMAAHGKTMALALSSAAIAATAFSVSAAADYEALERSFTNLVTSQGKDADLYIQKLKKATRDTASQASLISQANRAMLLGLDVDTLVNMAEGATVIAQATGQSSEYLFESLALGVGRQSRLLLDNLGIIVDTERAYQEYAAALGKSTSELTEQEQKTAFLQAAMDGLNSRVESLGGFSEDTKASMAKLKASMQDMAVSVGETFLPAVNDAVTAVNEWGDAGGWEKVRNELSELGSDLGDRKDDIVNFGISTKRALDEIDLAWMRLVTNIENGFPDTLRSIIDMIPQTEHAKQADALRRWETSPYYDADRIMQASMDDWLNNMRNLRLENNDPATQAAQETAQNTSELVSIFKQSMEYDRHVYRLEKGVEGIDARDGYTVESTEKYHNDYSKYMANSSGAK